MYQHQSKLGQVRNLNAQMRKCFNLSRMTAQEEKENPVPFNAFHVTCLHTIFLCCVSFFVLIVLISLYTQYVAYTNLE